MKIEKLKLSEEDVKKLREKDIKKLREEKDKLLRKRRKRMTREQFDKLYKGKAVHCPTEKLADEFLVLAESFGYRWGPGGNEYQDYEEDTCYNIKEHGNVMYSGLSYYKEKGYDIVKFVSQGIGQEIEQGPELDWKITTFADIRKVILDYLGVEIEEEFKIKDEGGIYEDDIFKIDKDLGVRRPRIGSDDGRIYSNVLLESLLDKSKYQIIKIEKPLLTNEEKEFLSNFEFKAITIEEFKAIRIERVSKLCLIREVSHHAPYRESIDLTFCKHKFSNLEIDKLYLKKELGLEE